ncbi:MAG: hypothetical protein H7Z75_03280 [Ferruginibacter sp.]|nr:hypothetical protein [Cytophagales bacterium]
MEDFLPTKPDEPAKVQLKNHSVTPALVKTLPGFENLEVFSLIGSDDVLPQSPAYVFGGSVDGAGYLKSQDGKGFTLLVNHEDNFAVSRITFDETFKPVKGEYILNSDGGVWRLCSATLATPKEHGFGPLYLTCGESGKESMTHALEPFASPASAGIDRAKPALGMWSAENALPLPQEAYAGKTVIVIGDDDSEVDGGQVALYVSTTGDLNNGKLYVLKRTDDNQRERDTKLGESYPVEFVEIDQAETGLNVAPKIDELKALKFGRVEDLDYRKGGGANGREIYFNVTGQANTGFNADYSRTKYGRTYKLVLDDNDPTKGSLSVVLDGDERGSEAGTFQNPDNICVTNNFAYIQEDSNVYGDETHDSYVYQYNLNTKELKVVLELDHRRQAPDAGKYGSATAATSRFGSWEYGAMVDVSDLIGIPNTFSICIQPHSWRGDRYKGVDGGSKRLAENQASQIILVKGIAK